MYLDAPEESQIEPGQAVVGLSDEDWRSVGPGYRYIGGKLVPPEPVVPAPPTPEQIQAHLVAAIQAHLDAQAQAMGYDNIATAVSYADEPAVPKFQAEGAALRAWRSLVWAACYEHLAAVQAGTLALPTAAEAIALLPSFVAPEAA